jgi:hypothetical protein
MRNLVQFINEMTDYKTLACCCGHGKYNMTIVVKARCQPSKRRGLAFELLSCQYIPRKRRFYKRDKQGHYYIPEAIEGHRKQHGGRYG